LSKSTDILIRYRKGDTLWSLKGKVKENRKVIIIKGKDGVIRWRTEERK
jgi:hypothetical protein